MKHNEQQKLLQFLTGYDMYMIVRSQILMISYFPFGSSLLLVNQETQRGVNQETQRGVNINYAQIMHISKEGHAFFFRQRNVSKFIQHHKHGGLHCNYYNKKGYTKKNLFKLVAYTA